MFSDIKEEAFLTLIKSLNTEIKDIIIKTYYITYEKNCKTKEDKSWKFTLSKKRMREIHHSKSNQLWCVENDEAYFYINSFYYYGPYPATMEIGGIILEKQK